MKVKSSIPDFSAEKIPNFPYKQCFKHQYEFYKKHNQDIILRSPTSSGKTDAFLFSFINDYINCEERVKSLYLVPTRLLMHSQLANLTVHLDKFSIPYKILESGYTFAELFKHIWENDFIISSPDIIFYILLRQKHTQHIKYQYSEFINHLHSVIFDELHLFDTYTLFNIRNLIEIMKNIKSSVHIYLLSATIELKDIIDPIRYFVINGTSKTKEIKIFGKELDYFDYNKVINFLEENNFRDNTVYVCNSVDRAIRLHRHFKDSACLTGKIWYEGDDKTREKKIIDNLNKCKKGALTFTTSVFRQGIDISVKRLITEEPHNVQDAIQTFGRCGRHEDSVFIMLTSKSPLLHQLNAHIDLSRNEFEELLAQHFRPQEYEKLKKMMNAMWFKLYNQTKLKPHVEFLLTKEMERDFEEFSEFLPDLSFREPMPSVKYNDLMINVFELLHFKDAYKNIFPSDDAFAIGELRDGGRFIRREYKKGYKKRPPYFHPNSNEKVRRH